MIQTPVPVPNPNTANQTEFNLIITMNTTEQLKTLEIAILHGGSFYSKLAHAALAADPENRALIFKTFPHMETNYGPLSTYQLGIPRS